VLTSAAASTQTTILPTARTTLSMARWGAIPPVIGKIHKRFLTPTVSTWGFGLLSIAVAVPLILISETVLELAVVALGIPVCFYYGSTGLACAWYYRRELFTSARKFLLVGLGPLVGGLMFYGIGIYAITYYAHKANAEGKNIRRPDVALVVRRDRHGAWDRRDGHFTPLLPHVLRAPHGNGAARPARSARRACSAAPDGREHVTHGVHLHYTRVG